MRYKGNATNQPRPGAVVTPEILLLADGADPFPPPGGQSASLSCRLYAGGQDGHAPSLAQLRAALGL